MKGINKIIAVLFISCIASFSFAQNSSEQQKLPETVPGQKFSAEEYKAAKVEYVIDCGKLTNKEKNKFTPLYTELYKQKRCINHNARKLCREYSQDGNITKQEYLSMIDSLCQAKIDIANLEKDYVEKFKKILPAEKLYKVLKADENFDSEILKQMQKQKQE
ncbi:MAG: hypothetical protein MJY71_01735 [Bacteroidaceae bacterium]|nr:hypothetical protein [Bacteroidaceae bacterium]